MLRMKPPQLHSRPARRRAIATLVGAGTGAWLGAGAAPAAGPSPATRAAAARRPLVLVHGAWYGAWCWERLTPLLEQQGFAVTAPTLPGIAHRAVAAGAASAIDLEAHVDDLRALLRALDLRDVVLVGHSYGGMVISLLAERERERIGRLIYLDAFVPEPGQRVIDYLQPPERRAAIVKVGQETGFVPPVPARALGISDAADLAWAEARVTPQPFGTFAQKAALQRPAGEGLPRGYIACVEPASGSFGQFAARIENDASWQYRALRTGHCAMITAPTALAAAIVSMA